MLPLLITFRNIGENSVILARWPVNWLVCRPLAASITSINFFMIFQNFQLFLCPARKWPWLILTHFKWRVRSMAWRMDPRSMVEYKCFSVHLEPKARIWNFDSSFADSRKRNCSFWRKKLGKTRFLITFNSWTNPCWASEVFYASVAWYQVKNVVSTVKGPFYRQGAILPVTSSCHQCCQNDVLKSGNIWGKHPNIMMKSPSRLY